MFNLLLKLMLATALLEAGIRLSEALSCDNRMCAGQVERASRDVLRIQWKPISVFPEEAKGFR